jgi:hypothetical protein
MKKLLFIPVLTLVLLSSCHKNEGPVTATISFTEPAIGDTLALGEELHAEGTVTADGEMHGYTLSFYNVTTGQTIYTGSTENHSDAYSFHEHWVNNVSDTSTIRVRLEVVIDHDGNTTKKDINVVCLP